MNTRALVLHGGWPGHRPDEVAGLAASWLAGVGFDVTLSGDPAIMAGGLDGFDLMVPVWTQSALDEALSPDQERGVLQAVERGMGLCGWHGMTASWRASQAWQWLVGGTFVAHPGDHVRYRVDLADDPLVQGIPGFELVSEQYYMHVDPANRVLATTCFTDDPLPWLAGVRMPVAWCRQWGAGRVFYHAIGHSPSDLLLPAVQLLTRRGIEWARRR